MGKNWCCTISLGVCSANISWPSTVPGAQTPSAEGGILYMIQDPHESAESPKILLGKKGLPCREPVSSNWVTGGSGRHQSENVMRQTVLKGLLQQFFTWGHTEQIPQHLYRCTSGFLGSEDEPLWGLELKQQRNKCLVRFINQSLLCFQLLGGNHSLRSPLENLIL